MTQERTAPGAVVIRMGRGGAVLAWVLYVPFSVLVALVALAYAVGSDGPGWGRALALVAGVLALAQIPWFLRGARPRRDHTLELVMDEHGITGRLHGEEQHVPRGEVWFVEIREVTPRSGVVFVGVHRRPDGLAVGWMPNWGLNVSSGKVRRLLSRAGYPWVLVLNDRVWSSEGVGDDARAAAGSPP